MNQPQLSIERIQKRLGEKDTQILVLEEAYENAMNRIDELEKELSTLKIEQSISADAG